MAEYQKVFEIKSKLKNYQINEFDDFENFLEYASAFDLIIVDTSLKGYFEYRISGVYYLECTEITKSWERLKDILDIFVENRISKKSKIIIVGGGVLQDAASFCCSIFNRGVEFEFVPTTLLSMVDSCIGGKTSINYGDFKNKLGNFYPPNKIHISNIFISTLPKVEIYSGLGEVFKFLVLQFKFDNLAAIFDNLPEIKNDLIFDCLKYKASIIEIDEFDQGLRLTLNFGHTFGHAIESIARFKVPHGIGVVWGITIANEMSFQLGLISEKSKLTIEKYATEIINALNWEKKWFNFEELFLRIKMDKKNSDVVKMILMDENKKEFILKEVEEEMMSKSMCIVNQRMKLL
jgi:3-dehydroquinate synthase